MTTTPDQLLDQAIADFTDALSRAASLAMAARLAPSELDALKLSTAHPDLSQLDERKADIHLALRDLASHTLVAACDIYEADLLGKAPRTNFNA
jgi:hypothetical protein